MAEFKQGDIVWYNTGDHIVKCTITRVDDQWRKKYGKDGVLYYEIDEPVGRSLADYELTYSFDEASADFVKTFNEYAQMRKEAGKNEMPNPSPTLQESRELSCRGILATHLEGDDFGKMEKVPQNEIDELMSLYPPKEYKKDWFGWEDICC